MKNVRCPQCQHVISFDETKYENGQVLVVRCPSCDKKFGVRVKREVKEPVNESAKIGRASCRERV